MIYTINQKEVLNNIVQKYCKLGNCEWISEDECIQYKNTEYENVIIGLGIGEYNKHLLDDDVFADVELTHYYQNQIIFFIIVSKNNDNTVNITIHQNMGTGLNYSKTIEKHMNIV